MNQGASPSLDPAEPFDVHVALPARDQESQRVALLRPQRLAVLALDQQDIVQALLERNAARHVSAVRPFGQNPFRCRS